MEVQVMDNRTIANQLIEMAHLLARRQENLYRVRAYRRAAQVVLGLERPVEEIVAEEGRQGLKHLPGIGPSLAETIETLVRTGEIAMLKEHEQALVAV
jgi:DNA polymerase (family 10)